VRGGEVGQLAEHGHVDACFEHDEH
jgi:hypothetical protein